MASEHNLLLIDVNMAKLLKAGRLAGKKPQKTPRHTEAEVTSFKLSEDISFVSICKKALCVCVCN